MANYQYLSYFLDDKTPIYGGSSGIDIVKLNDIAKGDTANTKRISFHNHSGTHIDFPNHFLENGKIMVRWEATAKHTAEVFGHPATQKTVYFNGHDILKVEHGKITELWHIEQLLQLNSQLQ